MFGSVAALEFAFYDVSFSYIFGLIWSDHMVSNTPNCLVCTPGIVLQDFYPDAICQFTKVAFLLEKLYMMTASYSLII